MRTVPLLVAFFIASSCWAQTELSQEVRARVNQNVFEIVVAKPKTDNETYAQPLPLNLVPYQERTDTQYSIGTAFAIGGGRFVSAAHVFGLDGGSLLSPISLRDANGRIYPVGKILAYSDYRDYAVFSVPGLKAPGLPVSSSFQLNEPVYSVGNAYGQGVVIRNGVLTSRTPEDRSGAWKWLRFTAAASPGNSGGPLIDQSGNVIGIVTMKSQNENLNYALPMDQIDYDPVAIQDLQGRYTLPNVNHFEQIQARNTFDLPMSVDELRNKMSQSSTEADLDAARRIVGDPSARFTATAPGANAILGNVVYTTFPKVLAQSSNDTWQVQQVDKMNTVQVGDDGDLRYGSAFDYDFFALTDPSDIDPVASFKSPRLLIDTILRGYPLSRTVAGQQIRVTSLGDPSYTEHYTDAHGRKWFIVRCDLAFADRSQLFFVLPTPNGAVGFTVNAPFAEWRDYIFDLKFFSNFLVVSYEGSLKQWKAFLAASDLRPANFGSLSFTYREFYTLSIESPDMSLSFTRDLIPIRDDTQMGIGPVYVARGDKIVWENAWHIIAEPHGSKALVAVEKVFTPPSNASDERLRQWNTLSSGKYPFNEEPYKSDGATYVDGVRQPVRSAVSSADSGPTFLYGVELRLDGYEDSTKALKKFSLLKNGFHAKDPNQVSRKPSLSSGDSHEEGQVTEIQGKTIFQAITLGSATVFDQFIKTKTNIDTVNEDGRSPLMVALRLGESGFARELVAAGATVNRTDRFGSTPLILALRYTDYKTALAILDAGADPSTPGPAGATPLMIAMDRKFLDMPEKLISAGADITAVNSFGRSALSWALITGRNDVASQLIKQGADVGRTDTDGWTSLMYALRYCSSDTARLVIEHGGPTGGKNNGSWTSLLFAIRYGHADLIDALLKSSPETVNVANDKGAAPLQVAAQYGTPDVIGKLLAAGANIDATDQDGVTALNAALLSGHEVIAWELLQHGASVGGADKNGWTPLMSALRYCSTAMARRLIAHGAEPGGVNKDGWTPLLMALRYKHSEIAVELLKAAPNSANTALSNGTTPLMMAARDASPQVIEALVAAGADPQAQDKSGWTALMFALRYGTSQSATALLDHMKTAPERTEKGWTALSFAARYMPGQLPPIVRLGMPVNQATSDGWTPLDLAAYGGHLEAVKWLLSNGADPTLRTNKGETALQIAKRVHRDAVAAYLESLAKQ